MKIEEATKFISTLYEPSMQALPQSRHDSIMSRSPALKRILVNDIDMNPTRQKLRSIAALTRQGWHGVRINHHAESYSDIARRRCPTIVTRQRRKDNRIRHRFLLFCCPDISSDLAHFRRSFARNLSTAENDGK